MTTPTKRTDGLTTSQGLVIDYLNRGRTLTNKVALTCLGVGSLSSRVSELRRLGYKIVTDTEEDTLTGRLFKKYNIAATKAGPIGLPELASENKTGA